MIDLCIQPDRNHAYNSERRRKRNRVIAYALMLIAAGVMLKMIGAI